MREQYHGFERITIKASDNVTQATIVPSRGGFVSSLILPFSSGARETLFLHDFAWNKEIDDLVGGIPFLFPVCARISRDNKVGVYLYNGKQYELKIHGFSWYQAWEVVEAKSDCVKIMIQDTPETFERYPFHFKVVLSFEVTPGQLVCRQTYYNTDAKQAMPFYAGFHPYFLTPPANMGKDAVLLHAKFIGCLKYNNDTFTDIVGESPPIKTPVSVASNELIEQLCILGEDRKVSLTFPNGDQLDTYTQCEQDPSLFRYMQLYTIPEKPFFCVERWMSFVNAINTVDGVQWLKPLEEKEACFLVKV